ncbi:MAG: glycine betaine/L-proline ABC transporter ATP-binding protein [Burkholderiaceae bacterium]
MEKISVQNISKVFGPDPRSILPLIEQGMGKQEILEQHGHVVGIRDVSLSIEAGETFVIMGLSGSGKSTLIRHFNRLIEPTAGRILIDGDDVIGLSDRDLLNLRRNKVSMVFQRFGLLPHRTVRQNVAFGLLTSGTPKAQAMEKADAQIELVGLGGFGDHYPRQLSGGMQQRVGLARALATDAEILLMDEAFSALDPLIRNDMQNQLNELQKTLNKTIVFITHDLDEALKLGHHIAILKDGELRQLDTGPNILLKPADDYVERFVRDVNRARVVNMGSIARPAPTLPLADTGVERCREAMDEGGVLLITEADMVKAVVSRAFVDANQDRSDEWWQRPGNLPAPSRVRADAVIDECMAELASSEMPVLVLGADERLRGVVSRMTAMEAMAGRSG